MNQIYFLSLILFSIGLYGVISRTNLLIMLVAIEIMFNSILIILVAAISAHANPEGATLFFVVIAVAACEVAVGLSIAIALFRSKKSIDISDLTKLKG